MMAAFNYYGNPYGGYYYPQNTYQPMMQPQPQAQAQPVQTVSPTINQSGIIWISGESEATMYPVAPNSAVALWDRNGKAIYLKQADATGKPTMRIYDLVERAEFASDGTAEQGGKSVAYATKDELSAIVGALKGLSSEVDTMKSDLYGLSGRKKSVKKTEVTEDDA